MKLIFNAIFPPGAVQKTGGAYGGILQDAAIAAVA